MVWYRATKCGRRFAQTPRCRADRCVAPGDEVAGAWDLSIGPTRCRMARPNTEGSFSCWQNQAWSDQGSPNTYGSR